MCRDLPAESASLAGSHLATSECVEEDSAEFAAAAVDFPELAKPHVPAVCLDLTVESASFGGPDLSESVEEDPRQQHQERCEA